MKYCPNCGGKMDYITDEDFYECNYCDNTYFSDEVGEVDEDSQEEEEERDEY